MNLSRTKLFTGSTMGNVEPQMQYVRLKKEGVGFWFKGQVTEAFPPEDSTNNHPFKIATFGESDSSGQITGYKATVTPGTINLVMANNHIAQKNELKEFSYSKDTLAYVYIKCTINGDGNITNAIIEVTNSQSTPEASVLFGAPTTLRVLLGTVYNSTVYQVVINNLKATLETTNIKQKSNVGVGEYPFDLYLNWAVI